MGFGGFFGFLLQGAVAGDELAARHIVRCLTAGPSSSSRSSSRCSSGRLTQASTRSMKRMQALQPQMKAIKEKYKDDPTKMNRKTMEFMKENKVNPLGGCLPMLLQMPVFFGFYPHDPQRHRIARRAVSCGSADLSKPDTLCSRLVHSSSASRSRFALQPAAAAHGRDDALAGAPDAALAGHGPDPGEDDALHAADVPGVPLQLLGRPDALLDRATTC